MEEPVYKREEVRGLFVLGLLTVLVATRYQYYKEIPLFGSMLLVQLLDFTIIFWSLYAFFMVIGLSEDLFGKRAAEETRGFSELFIVLSFAVTIFLVCVSLHNAFADRFIWLLVLLCLPIAYGVISKVREMDREGVISYLNNAVRSVFEALVVIVFISGGFVILFFDRYYLILGIGLCLCAVVLFVFAKERKKHPCKNQKPKPPD